jgi:hypothetical protein
MSKNSNQKQVVIDGKKMPFTSEQYITVLKHIKKHFMNGVENFDKEGDANNMDALLTTLESDTNNNQNI